MIRKFLYLVILLIGFTLYGCENQEDLNNQDTDNIEVIEDDENPDSTKVIEEDLDNEDDCEIELTLCDDGEYAEVCIALFNDKTYGYNFLSSRDGFDVYEYVGEREVPITGLHNIIYVGNNRVYFSLMSLESYLDKVYFFNEKYYRLIEVAEVNEEIFLNELVLSKHFNVTIIVAPDLKEGEYRCYDIGATTDACINYEDLHK